MESREAAPSPGCLLSPLGRVLSSLPVRRRTWLVATWAAASDPRRRRALAQALADPFEVDGARLVLERLRRDPDPDVRCLAASAVRARGFQSE